MTQADNPKVKEIKGLTEKERGVVSPFYIEGDSKEGRKPLTSQW